jgi:hypothetical protein
MNKQVIEVQGKLYQVYRTISEEQVLKVSDGVELLKQYWHCDRAFKNQGKYYFVKDIIEVDYETVTTIER